MVRVTFWFSIWMLLLLTRTWRHTVTDFVSACRGISSHWHVPGDVKLRWWEVMVWKCVQEEMWGGGREVERRQWQLSHSNKCPPPTSPLWAHTQRPRLVGWGGAGWGTSSPHSCHRAVTQDVIVPPHLDWVMGGLPRSAPLSLTDFWINCEEKLFTFSRVKMHSERCFRSN